MQRKKGAEDILCWFEVKVFTRERVFSTFVIEKEREEERERKEEWKREGEEKSSASEIAGLTNEPSTVKSSSANGRECSNFKVRSLCSPHLCVAFLSKSRLLLPHPTLHRDIIALLVLVLPPALGKRVAQRVALPLFVVLPSSYVSKAQLTSCFPSLYAFSLCQRSRVSRGEHMTRKNRKGHRHSKYSRACVYVSVSLCLWMCHVRLWVSVLPLLWHSNKRSRWREEERKSFHFLWDVNLYFTS